MLPRRTLPAALLVVSLPSALFAGTVLSTKETGRGGSHTGKIYIQGGNLRIESTGADGRHQVVLYRSDAGSLYVLNDQEKSYLVINRDTMRAPQEAALQALEGRKDMTDAQRKMIRDRMAAAGAMAGGAGRPGPTEAPTYKKIASGVAVNGFTTDEYEADQGDEKVREVWLADPSAVTFDRADLAAFESMGKSFGGRPGGRGPSFAFGGGNGAPAGVPIKTVHYSGGQVLSTHELTGFEKQDVPAASFAVPPGYTKKEIGAPRMPN
ncbi:MAG TPA: hypothetical protein VGE98_08195 [Thermoanaerobaculia bacterium]